MARHYTHQIKLDHAESASVRCKVYGMDPTDFDIEIHRNSEGQTVIEVTDANDTRPRVTYTLDRYGYDRSKD